VSSDPRDLYAHSYGRSRGGQPKESCDTNILHIPNSFSPLVETIIPFCSTSRRLRAPTPMRKSTSASFALAVTTRSKSTATPLSFLGPPSPTSHNGIDSDHDLGVEGKNHLRSPVALGSSHPIFPLPVQLLALDRQERPRQPPTSWGGWTCIRVQKGLAKPIKSQISDPCRYLHRGQRGAFRLKKNILC